MNDEQRRAMFAKIKSKGFTTPKEKQFVNTMQEEFSSAPPDIQSSVRGIYLVKHKKGSENAGFITKDRDIEISYKKGTNNKENRTTLRHELDHAYFMSKQKTDKDAIRKYAIKVGKRKPFTLNLELVEDEMVYDKKNNVKRPTIAGTNIDEEYVDEIHSETNEYLYRKKLGLPDVDLKKQKSLFNLPIFKKAVKAYNELHQ